MSLINDALRQAKAAQPKNTGAAEGPALRPVERHHRSNGGLGLLLPALIVVILALAGILLWQWFHGKPDLQVRARTIAQPVNLNPALETNIPTSIVPPLLAEKGPQVIPAESVKTPAATSTNEVPLVKKSPSLKLQSVFYTAKNPSVVINGKMLFIGDHWNKARVIAIEPEAATIVTADGRTNRLELP
jgi:hypothetical protein